MPDDKLTYEPDPRKRCRLTHEELAVARAENGPPMYDVARASRGSGGFPCPDCGHGSITVNSRPRAGGFAVYRRHQCTACLRRFTTTETMESGVHKEHTALVAALRRRGAPWRMPGGKTWPAKWPRGTW